MNIKREQGFSTLLITVVISLIMALYVFSLLSVELFNSKKTQNIIISQELKSMSASGLQCAVDIILRSGQKPTSASIDYTPCVDAVITAIQIPATSTYKVTSTATAGDAESTMSQLFTSSSMNGVKSAFSSSGSVRFNGAYVIDPYEGVKSGTGYNCSAIRSGGEVLINGKLTVRDPYDQDGQRKEGSDGQLISCNSTHKTVATSSTGFKKDIEQNIKDLSLFKDNFAVDRDSWAEAKALFDTIIIGKKTTTEIKGSQKSVNHLVVTDCSEQINGIIAHNKAEFIASKKPGYEPNYKKYVWVEGSCNLSGVKFGVAEENAVAITLVVKDGLLTYHGSGYFHGNLYLFDYAMTHDQLLAAWELNATLKQIATAHKLDLKNAPFYFSGSFETRGAFNLDSPNRTCDVGGAFKPGYSKGKIDYGDSRFGKTVMLEGSWHDF
ncbi:hypothetical protein [Photobacterium sanguinicancri]|uniref:Type 4 fimbrial biogenesis protein PilX N-terminal domain-containing protein n=1 Tax=Photobacterium sanguinicancri TaxID=875932 RepID=A0AAW7Y6V0_9GAMM|nr:hypothetical protein [Photobacterium sanguinicancri]MDO6543705.1 hypothetical protein [Photobacterium sanguinicancri]